jgi:hypothetical protein
MMSIAILICKTVIKTLGAGLFTTLATLGIA